MSREHRYNYKTRKKRGPKALKLKRERRRKVEGMARHVEREFLKRMEVWSKHIIVPL